MGTAAGQAASAAAMPGRWVVAEAQWLGHTRSGALDSIYIQVTEHTSVQGVLVHAEAVRGRCKRNGEAVFCEAVDAPPLKDVSFEHDLGVTSATLRGRVAGHVVVLHWDTPHPAKIDAVEFDQEFCTSNGGQQVEDVALERNANANGAAFDRHLESRLARFAVLGVGAGLRPCA